MPRTITILNWNTQIASPRTRGARFEAIRQTIAQYDADIICLTEAYPETMPSGGHTITGGLSVWGNYEKYGARKVVLWSRSSWEQVDALGSDRLPEGRFVSGLTIIEDVALCIAGMCIPYHDYRNREKWGDQRRQRWQGACDYLDALRESVLPQSRYQERTVLLGDFNLQIPPYNYPRPSEPVNHKREVTFAGWHIPTSGDLDDPALDKRFIDHVALTDDITVTSMRFISRFDANGSNLSDHNGVFITLTM